MAAHPDAIVTDALEVAVSTGFHSTCGRALRSAV